ncbi:Type II secretion system protein G precursor [Sporotomaculum syntrophicum]|uniref:Type II secretion system protein G n=1 Tax=Sporotomaculum syntrophicum TaxID=182264 RepID=A0A9D2WSE0_9FIRM|nr:prepilin-type N-terminal cleavage/methylation domain-containing protein [Sporotomaculum syntrophicum]KAF1086574.1 Type II secretion system protein G precursor [Sporotomaculum syntrophicum]
MFRKISYALKNRKGFTLVELMVVVVIIGILVAIAVPVYNNVTEKAEKNACAATVRTLNGASSMYNANEGSFPTDVDMLVNGGYILETPECPANGTYTAEAGVFYCSEHNPASGDDTSD